MRFGNPYALLALALLPLVALLYIRRAGRREAAVPTLALWKAAAAEGAAEAGRRLGALDLPLVLALLTLAAAVFAASEPTVIIESSRAPNLFVVLDRSASMRSLTAFGRTRWCAGVDDAESLIRALRPERVTVVSLPLAAGPGVQESDAAGAARLLRTLDATDVPLNMVAELSRCAGLARRAAAVIVVTDKPATVPKTLAGKPVLVVSHGAPSRNIAIDAFEVSVPDDLLRAPAKDAPGLGVFVGVRNHSNRLATVSLALLGGPQKGEEPPEIRVGGPDPKTAPVVVRTVREVFDETKLDIPAGERAVFTSTKPPLETQWVEVQLNAADDDLASDNRAVAVRSGPRRFRVAYVGRGNPFILRALELLPGVELAQFSLSGDVTGDFDLRVYDSVTPGALPEGNVVLIDPSGRVGPFAVAGAARDDAGLRATVLKDSTLLRHVDIGALRFRRALKIEAPGAETLLAAGEGAALLHWEDEKSRVLIIGCGLALSETNWPMLASFPLFWADIVADAAGRRDATQDVPTFTLTGERIVLRQPPDAGLSVAGPRGPVDLAPGRGARSSFLPLDAGVYTVAGGPAERRYAVNMLHPSESDNAGSPSQPTREEAESLLAPDRAEGVSLWRHLAAAALFLALGYWASAGGRGR